ncbi:MAG TPA: hypothetical protein VGF13_07240 [Verrucomicrobiae bacterium]|jgi:hypothetical protein
MKQILLLIALLLVNVGAHAQVSQWVAYNDHIRGSTTGTNTSSWNLLGLTVGSSGPMTNFDTGALLPVTMSITNVTNGTTGAGTMLGPGAGTPAFVMFSNKVDFGTGANSALQMVNTGKIAHAFTGLDPSKRYSWHGTAARGNNYSARWTLVEIAAATYTDAHTLLTTGAFVTVNIPTLPANAAVFNSGENRAPGVVVGWTNIAPNADGSIVIYQATYRGPMPAGFTTTAAADYGYAIVADRLEEFSTGVDTCVGIFAQSGDMSVAERGLATFSISATGTPQTIRWFRSNNGGANYSQIPGANGSTYSIPSVAVSDNAAKFYATVSNSLCNVSSAVKTLTVVADTAPPTALSALLNTNLTTITISFSEAIDSGIDPSSFTVFPTGTNPDDGTISSTATVVNGTNIVVTVAPGTVTPGANYSVRILDVYDTAATANLILPYPTILPLRQNVLVFDFNRAWRYDQSGNDLGTAWKETAYDDSAWLSGAGILGLETTTTTLTFLSGINPPTGTNTILSLTNNTGAGLGGTNVTFYFRTSVNIPNFNPALATVTLRGYIDDGAALYINGVERFRYNLVTNANYTRFSVANLAEGALVVSNLTGFIQGNNVIAVEVHQDGVASSDIDWGMRLEALVSTFAPSGPTLTPSLNGNTLTITWNGGGEFQRSSNLNNPANWVTIPGATSPFVTNTTGGPLFFRVFVP